MEAGIAILLTGLMCSFSFLASNIFNNLISGLWLKCTDEIEEGERIRIKTDFNVTDGVVRKIRIRNIEIQTDEGILLKESKDIFKEDVMKVED